MTTYIGINNEEYVVGLSNVGNEWHVHYGQYIGLRDRFEQRRKVYKKLKTAIRFLENRGYYQDGSRIDKYGG